MDDLTWSEVALSVIDRVTFASRQTDMINSADSALSMTCVPPCSKQRPTKHLLRLHPHTTHTKHDSNTLADMDTNAIVALIVTRKGHVKFIAGALSLVPTRKNRGSCDMHVTYR